MRNSEASSASLDGAVFAKQIRLLFSKRFDLGANLVVATLTAAMFGRLFPGRLPVIWLTLFWLVILVRVAIRRHFLALPAGLELASGSRVYLAATMLTGALWGATGSVVLMTTDPTYQALIVFVLGGMMAGGLLTNAPYRPAVFAFLLPTMSPIIVMLLFRGSTTNLEMAAMLALFTTVLAITGSNVNRTIVENLRLGIQQELLTGKLTASESAMTEAQAAAHVGGFEFHPADRTVACSAEIFRIFGLDPATFDRSFDTLLGRVHPADRAAIAGVFADFVRTGESQDVDFQIVMAGDAVKYLHATGRTLAGSDPDSQGRPARLFVTVQDVTEQTNSANELRYRDSLLHAVTAGTTIMLETDSIESGMTEALKILGESMRLDRVGVVQFPSDDGSSTPRYDWHAPGVAIGPNPASVMSRPSEIAPLAELRAQLAADKTLIFHRASGPGPFFAMLEFMDIESLLMVPVSVDQKLWGLVNAESCRKAREWTANEIDTIISFAGIAGSVVARYDARVSLETSEQRFRELTTELQFANVLLKTEMETSPDGILVVDPDRQIVSINQSFIDIWRVSVAVLQTHDSATILGEGAKTVKDPRKFQQQVEYLEAHRDENSDDEIECIDGRTIDRRSRPLVLPDGKYLARVWYFRDISLRKRAESQALALAHDDVLTGLVNRSVFVEALAQAIARAGTAKIGFGVIYLDLDHFKDVNDTLGHPVGDELLKAVADRLRATMRDGDTIARFGGDEFAVIVSGVDVPADAALIADRLSAALAKPFSIQGNEIRSGASFGIDLYGPQSAEAETLLSHADVALYAAKAEGRGGYRFFTEAMERDVRSRVTLGEELRAAVSGGQLFLVYQPQVAIDSGLITGFEALVRWQHPQRGVLGPEVFIPVAESTGVVVALGQWVLIEACRQIRSWIDDGVTVVRVAVNVSGLQFKLPLELERSIIDALTGTGVPPRLLEIELTESVLMDVSVEHSQALARLRARGVTIAIDDFGTGYSSLGYLRRFPVDRIKIARDFLKDLTTIPGQAAIAKATIGLARDLGIAVIAEGVERREQVDALRGWGCNEIQGFYFSKPLCLQDATRALRNGSVLPPGAVRTSRADAG